MDTPDRPALRHLEQLTAQLLDGVILIDPAGTILGANAAALAMHGVQSVAQLGATAEGYAERFTLRTRDHRPLKHREYPLFRLLAGDSFPDLIVEVAPAGDDQARWVHQVRDVVMDIDGGEPKYLALVIDNVSARFDAEARFAAMFNANPAPALVLRLRDQRILKVNAGFETLTGFTPDELTGQPLFALDLLVAWPIRSRCAAKSRKAKSSHRPRANFASPTDRVGWYCSPASQSTSPAKIRCC